MKATDHAQITIGQALLQAQEQGVERVVSQMLLLQACNRPIHDRAWLVIHAEARLESIERAHYEITLQRYQAGEPAAYLLGYQEFYGLTLLVDERVLVPRPDTETLVDWALTLFTETPLHAVDLGTGSGAIALALKKMRPQWIVSAIDASSAALEVAQENATTLQLDVQWKHGHWLVGCEGLFNLIVSNPPYIAENDPHLAALQHEPQMALTSGPDGLHDIRTIIEQSAKHLLPGGWLLLEHGYDQATQVQQLLWQAGFSQVQSRQDLAGIARCTGGCWNAQPISKQDS